MWYYVACSLCRARVDSSEWETQRAAAVERLWSRGGCLSPPTSRFSLSDTQLCRCAQLLSVIVSYGSSSFWPWVYAGTDPILTPDFTSSNKHLTRV